MSKRWERAQERVVGEEGRMERKGQTERRSGLGRKRRGSRSRNERNKAETQKRVRAECGGPGWEQGAAGRSAGPLCW